jgi:hypothetical protein
MRSVSRVVAAVALSVTAVLGALPASAEPAAAADEVRAQQMPGAPDAPESCRTATSYAGYQWGGLRLCAYRWGAHHFSGGTVQIYVVGTDHKVWTRWRNPDGSFSPWQVLRDGRVLPGDHWSIQVTTAQGEPLLRVIGNEPARRRWCILRSSSRGWGDWKVCIN